MLNFITNKIYKELREFEHKKEMDRYNKLLAKRKEEICEEMEKANDKIGVLFSKDKELSDYILDEFADFLIVCNGEWGTWGKSNEKIQVKDIATRLAGVLSSIDLRCRKQ